LTPQQKEGLEYIRERVLEPFGSTGVQKVINTAVFDVLKYKVVFPVEDENKWTDSRGNVLPDAFLLPEDGTALDLAFKIHTDIGKKFIAAIDARTKRRLGKDAILKNEDVIKIVAGR
ncbi:MAG: ribosome-binding ATPase, partial [Candidatus Diapherotrites archaeon]|nr:ribosome-binding ATPase [Candidatus Diapherotrites archaeon]